METLKKTLFTTKLLCFYKSLHYYGIRGPGNVLGLSDLVVSTKRKLKGTYWQKTERVEGHSVGVNNRVRPKFTYSESERVNRVRGSKLNLNSE